MRFRSATKFDPAQEVLFLDSSAEPTPLPKDNQTSTSTLGPPLQQYFVDSASIIPSNFRSLDPNPQKNAVTTAPSGNLLPEKQAAPAVVFLKRDPIVQSRFVPLQKWEGTVLQVSEESFFARLIDLTSDGADEEAEFPLEEVSDADRPLIGTGAIFYWNIGYIDSLSGERTRASIIRFRRLPVWRAEELTKAKQKAQCISDELDWK